MEAAARGIPANLRPSAFAIVADLLPADGKIDARERRFLRRLTGNFNIRTRVANQVIEAMLVTREPGGTLALGGSGVPIDRVGEMNRFSQEALFGRLAAAERLGLELMPPLAAAIAEFHRIAEPRTDHGGRPGMEWVIEGNAAGFAEYGQDVLDPLARRLARHANAVWNRYLEDAVDLISGRHWGDGVAPHRSLPNTGAVVDEALKRVRELAPGAVARSLSS